MSFTIHCPPPMMLQSSVDITTLSSDPLTQQGQEELADDFEITLSKEDYENEIRHKQYLMNELIKRGGNNVEELRAAKAEDITFQWICCQHLSIIKDEIKERKERREEKLQLGK
mmetsp:Transcript_50880/g.65152  ORF Transcript_50880/g.65152 Transcript_50880/m.65152 type:complete len:114 (+) Transcript_50880:140-481(+)